MTWRPSSRDPEIEKDLNGVQGYFHPTAAAGLNYSNLYFPLAHLSLDEMKDLQILLSLITKVDTENTDFATLNTEIRKNSSGINFNLRARDLEDGLKRYLSVGYTTIGDQIHAMVPWSRTSCSTASTTTRLAPKKSCCRRNSEPKWSLTTTPTRSA